MPPQVNTTPPYLVHEAGRSFNSSKRVQLLAARLRSFAEVPRLSDAAVWIYFGLIMESPFEVRHSL